MKIDAIGSLQAPFAQHVQKEQKSGFDEVLKDFLADVNGDLKQASKAQEALLKGKVDNMVELMTQIEKADISLRMATEIRNKALEAYQEIMRMQV